MSTRKVMSAVSTAFDFTSDKITQNILEFARAENLEMNEIQKRKFVSLVKGTFEQSLSLTANSIEKAIQEK